MKARSDKPKKILMLIDQFHPIVGGAEQQALRISLKLIEEGHTVSVLTRKSRANLEDYEHYRGIHIYRLPITGVSGVSKLKSTLPAVKWLLKNQDKYDIIHCHGVNPLEWGALFAGFKTRKPYVIKIPLSNYLNYAGAKKGFRMTPGDGPGRAGKIIRPVMLPALKLVRRSLIKNADRVFSISPEISRSLSKSGYRNICNIPNGIDTDQYRPGQPGERSKLRRKLNLPEDSIIFLYSGRLAIEKNIRTLVQAWDLFTRKYGLLKARLLLLGGGKGQTYSVEDELKQMVLDGDIENLVFMGTVDNVIEYLRAADCFVLPSYWEGMSNALLESMACGLPSICSDIPGNRALVEPNKSGLLFDPDNVFQLAEYLHQITRDEILRRMMGERARNIAVERYSLSRVTGDILREYENILA